MEYNFKKYRHGQADTLNEPYDLRSVMHYPRMAFSVNGRPTIVAKGNPNTPLGQRRGFSRIDKRQINKLYKCSGGGGGGGGVVTPRPPRPRPPTRPPVGEYNDVMKQCSWLCNQFQYLRKKLWLRSGLEPLTTAAQVQLRSYQMSCDATV